ncbi:hypothetical protein 65p331 [Aeromonas phage 65]|uniref:Uncharacterized protein n=2 Tax=Ishigurovirus osborne TaxID=260149 RepID=A0A219YCM2_9CAUD|nr:hypothetical protein ST65p331 [Aeromonas phage 65]ADQ53339.1 hypothetical protein 65p331 [Aeromonas phage 65]APU01700.1 hypothetical protein [Aeromonas phage 65.2]
MKSVTIMSVQEWDDLVSSTYGRDYSFQQQDDCKERQTVYFSCPHAYPYDYENDTVPEKVNHPEMGVSFKAWLERDPKTPIVGQTSDWELNMWWERNFYPEMSMIVNDLHDKGLLPAGDYGINIDW